MFIVVYKKDKDKHFFFKSYFTVFAYIQNNRMAPGVCLAKKSPNETFLLSQIKEDMDGAKKSKMHNYVKKQTIFGLGFKKKKDN